MKKVIIKNAERDTTYIGEMEDPSAWIASCEAVNAWGKPERSISASETFDEADVLERFDLEQSPAIPAVLNEAGEIIQEAVPAVIIPMVKLRAEYTIEITDITAQVEQDKVNADALAYLASTDWMVIRFADSGLAIPEDVKAARAAARLKVVR